MCVPGDVTAPHGSGIAGFFGLLIRERPGMAFQDETN
jgi:hypothetical protein